MSLNQSAWKRMGVPREERRRQERDIKRDVKVGLATGFWHPFIEQEVPAPLRLKGCVAAYVNNLYVVQVFEQTTIWGRVQQLGVKRNDNAPVRDWSHMQRIKNELVGPERTAIEVYPAQSQVVDVADIYWLWVLPEGMQLPFSL